MTKGRTLVMNPPSPLRPSGYVGGFPTSPFGLRWGFPHFALRATLGVSPLRRGYVGCMFFSPFVPPTAGLRGILNEQNLSVLCREFQQCAERGEDVFLTLDLHETYRSCRRRLGNLFPSQYSLTVSGSRFVSLREPATRACVLDGREGHLGYLFL